MIGGTVQEIIVRFEEDAPEDGKTRQDFDSLYGYGVVTDKGEGDIEFRNSSNGYYGGWLELSEEEPYRCIGTYYSVSRREKVRMITLVEDYQG
jgi:hypothetical protein